MSETDAVSKYLTSSSLILFASSNICDIFVALDVSNKSKFTISTSEVNFLSGVVPLNK